MVPLKRFRKNILAALCLSQMIGCGGGLEQSSSTTAPVSFQSEEVHLINFDGQGKAQLDFSQVNPGSKLGLFFFSFKPEGGNFSLQIGSGTSAVSLQALEKSDFASEDNPRDQTAVFHEKLRLFESQMIRHTTPQKQLKFQANNGSKPTCSGGDGIMIKVLNSFENIDDSVQSCAIPMHHSDRVDYYVDKDALSVLDQTLLDKTIEDFEGKIDLERSILGNESDVDGDRRFAVYFTPRVNEIGGKSGGIVTGYFFGGDLYSSGEISSSNEMEIFYINVPDPNGEWGTRVQPSFWESNFSTTVLTHEFQHMINFNQKVLIRGGDVEEAWANEGLSHLLEDLSVEKHLGQISEENPSRAQLYLRSPEQTAFTAGTSIEQRGGTYLFLRYLYEQADLQRYADVANGDDLLKRLVGSDSQGVENIEQATGWAFRDLLLDFYATLQLSSASATSNPRYQLQGICITCAQDDQRDTVLRGVQNTAWERGFGTHRLSSPGVFYLEVSAEELAELPQDFSIQADPGMNPVGAWVVLE